MSIKLNPIMLVLGSLAAVVGGWVSTLQSQGYCLQPP